MGDTKIGHKVEKQRTFLRKEKTTRGMTYVNRVAP